MAQFMDSDSDLDMGGSRPGSPLPAEAATNEPSSPPLDLSNITPNTKKLIKIVKHCIHEENKKEATAVKRRLDLMTEKQDTMNHRVLEVKHGMGNVHKTVQNVEANQKKAQKLNPKDALDIFQQKIIKRLTWKHIQKGSTKNEMLSSVYETMRVEHGIPPSSEDYVRKFSQADASTTKSHLRGLVSQDLKNQDHTDFNKSTAWLKTHLSEDSLTVNDMEFLKIMSLALIKFENSKDVPLENRADIHNKNLVAESVEQWWHYVANKLKRFVDREESCGETVSQMMGQYGYEPTVKKNRVSM